MPADTAPPPSVVILGTDAVLAARPATAVQLAHACLQAGYQTAIPASWGDELLAAATLETLAARSGPAILCACPHVSRRLLDVGSDLEPFLVSLVAPPVAAARYVRELFGARTVRIAYVGRCPAAADDAIDARFTPTEFLATLAERGIRVEEQPTAFESVLPPDRRRHLSLPGGLPTPEALWALPTPRALVQLEERDLVVEIAQHLASGTTVLLDAAPELGCACSGAIAGVPPEQARALVMAEEPPRATAPVIDPATTVALDVEIAKSTRTPLPAEAPVVAGNSRNGSTNGAAHGVKPGAEQGAGRRRSVVARVPVATRPGEGRTLPRAYVARRRAPRPGMIVADSEERTPTAPVAPVRGAVLGSGPMPGALPQLAPADVPLPTPATMPAPSAPRRPDAEGRIERSVEPSARATRRAREDRAKATLPTLARASVRRGFARELLESPRLLALAIAAVALIALLVGVVLGLLLARPGAR